MRCDLRAEAFWKVKSNPKVLFETCLVHVLGFTTRSSQSDHIGIRNLYILIFVQ